MIYFDLLSMILFLSHDSGHEFDELIPVNLSYFYFFNIFVSILFFNVELIKN